MRYIETLTHECGARLHANTETNLKAKVASSHHTQHRGYPDEVGYVPHVVADPQHHDHTDSDNNLCSDADPKRATVFTACLGFPHLPIERTRRKPAIQNIVQQANCDINAVLDWDDTTVQTVLHERERLRMRAVRDDHQYALDEETTLTADPVEQILLTCARAAERRNGEVTAEGVREVLSFGRNNLIDDLPFAIDAITDASLDTAIRGKTCAPLLPQCEAHQQVLLYYIDNPEASIQDVVDATGISRGRFETFRLNRPNPECYDREYIASLDFDIDAATDTLRAWMQNSPHPVYDCAECDFWTYSKQGLAIHKSHLDDHEPNAVTDVECPDDIAIVPDTADTEGAAATPSSNTPDVDTLLNIYADATEANDPETEDTGPTPTPVEDVPSTGDESESAEDDDTGAEIESTDQSADETTAEDNSPTRAHAESEDAEPVTASDIVTQTDTPFSDIADALLMSNAEVLDHLLDALDDSAHAQLRRAFDIPEDATGNNDTLPELSV